jgi:hypothetical protein
MPQPYDGPVNWAAEAILQRPALAIKVAAVSAAWSMVEHDLEFFYAFLMSKWTDEVPDNEFVPTHPVALLTFSTLQTLNAKLDLLRSLGEWALTSDQASHLRDVLIPRIRARAKERNIVAHGVWGVDAGLPDRLILIKTFGSNSAYNEADFDAIRTRITTVLSEIRQFEQSVMASVQEHGWSLGPGEAQMDGPLSEGQE